MGHSARALFGGGGLFLRHQRSQQYLWVGAFFHISSTSTREVLVFVVGVLSLVCSFSDVGVNLRKLSSNSNIMDILNREDNKKKVARALRELTPPERA